MSKIPPGAVTLAKIEALGKTDVELGDNLKQQQTSIVSTAHLTSLKDILVRVIRKQKAQNGSCEYTGGHALTSSGSGGPLEIALIYLSSSSLPPSTF